MPSRALAERFAITTGSIVGREHLRLHRNNQDGVATDVTAERITLVVTDGCSSGGWSEVGARYAAAWLARSTPAIGADEPAATWADRVARRLVTTLRHAAAPLSSLVDLARTVHDYFLFSFLVAVITPERAVVFGAGDGVIATNGALMVLDPGPDNAPRYIGYAVLDPDRYGAVSIHHDAPTCDLETLALGTDGALCLPPGEVAEMTRDLRYVRNPSLLQKRLVVLARSERRLDDDTTLAVARRRAP